MTAPVAVVARAYVKPGGHGWLASDGTQYLKSNCALAPAGRQGPIVKFAVCCMRGAEALLSSSNGG
jgi:hypothetical protein